MEYHGTIIQTGVRCKKIWFYKDCSDWLIVIKNSKIFSSYVKHFSIILFEKIVESWLTCVNKFSWKIKETKLVPASFSEFLELSWKKKKSIYLKKYDSFYSYNLSAL